jgi:metacaspase-1
MATGYSLHIGLNSIDPNHYGCEGRLTSCENDANDMGEIARRQGYSSTKVLLTEQATADAFINEMHSLARKVGPGDILFLSYSGHGAQVPDHDGDEKNDIQDETWCLYDRMLIDDELFQLFRGFESGVRIFMISDSCHSGTVAKNSIALNGISFDELPRMAYNACEPLESSGIDRVKLESRLVPPSITLAVYNENRSLYRSLQEAAASAEQAPCAAGVILISACQDGEIARSEPNKNGRFTQSVKDVWQNGKFTGTYLTFHRSIMQWLIGYYQTPNFFPVGNVTEAFRNQKPFTI